MKYTRERVSIVFVGDSGVGKTCILRAFEDGQFPGDHVPRIHGNYCRFFEVDGVEYDLKFQDTSGTDDHQKYRVLLYTDIDCYVFCFSVDSRDSFENMTRKWLPEVAPYLRNTPIILVGTKADLRNRENIDTMTFQECMEMKGKLKAYNYIECSALQLEGLKEVVVEAVRAAVKKKSEKTCCVI